jgi:hypothetical protein
MSQLFTRDDIITTDKYLSLQSEDIVYVKTDLLTNNVSSMVWRNKPHTSRPAKVWITGHSDYPINETVFNTYQHNCKEWFTINRDVENEKLHALPLGITNDSGESGLHGIYGNLDIMCEVMSQAKRIRNLVYMNFSMWTHPERQEWHNYFINKSYVTKGKIENTLEGRKIFLEEIRNHLFVLCPRGNGIDTHRLWETLYMGSIPIVKRCTALKEFSDLPILFIDDISEIKDEVWLLAKYKDMSSRTWNIDKLKFSYWEYIIRNSEMN